MKKKKLFIKIVLTILLVPVIFFFLFFMLGEIIDGDLSGLSHLIQAAPLVLFLILVWK